MPDGPHLVAFAVAAFTVALIPGPGMLFVLARSLSAGRRTGLRSTAGTAMGGSVHVVAAAVGLSAVIATSATAFACVKYLGAAYLVYLGVRTLTARGPGPAEQMPAPPPSTAHAVRQGFLTEALNPKTALFFLTFLPQFVQPERGPVALQLLALGTVSVAFNSGADAVVATFSGRIGHVLRSDERWWRRQRTASGMALIALGGYAALGERR
jgi:threonine/homoserine/homoserine lactone efflux protein